jgi:hypothetical protein
MATVNAAQAPVKTVADPNAIYESLYPLWVRSRAACSGERFVKDYDSVIDTVGFKNFLIPFSPTMSQAQYDFYKAEAEWPGITTQFKKLLVGGLLRKQPQLTLPANVPPDAKNWILNEIAMDGSSLSSFLDAALDEEVQTSANWIFVDYPRLDEDELEELSKADVADIKPYPVIQPAEAVINWRLRDDSHGKAVLDRVIVRGYSEGYDENEFHATLVETIYVHELKDGYYQIRVFTAETETTSAPVTSGKLQSPETGKKVFKLDDTVEFIVNDERLDFIPAWPLDGSIQPGEPMLSAIIDKEIALYNKLSRRNHLLYGAATYTPVISGEITDEQFDAIVMAGLGAWLRLPENGKADVLKTPTEALTDYDRTIASAYEEMARLGVRMLSPETAQSGVALELRNASQTAQLGNLNTKISNTMRQVITFMINWRFELELSVEDVVFTMSSDFDNSPIGADWLRVATEWYETGKIPRSVWLALLKNNDMLPVDYDDVAGTKEITADQLLVPSTTEEFDKTLNGNGRI